MGKISRVDAFIEIVEAINSGDNHRANQMMKIVENSISADKKSKNYSSEIKLRREEKKVFLTTK